MPDKEEVTIDTSAPADPRQLLGLRASAIGAFERCQHEWAARWLYGIKQESGPWAEIGTASHAIVEDYLNKKIVEPEQHGSVHIVPVKERGKLSDYMHSKEEVRQHLIGTERELVMHFRPDAPPITMHIDAIYGLPDGTLLIEDHKTNRSYEDVDTWRARMQPRLYSWGARQAWSQYPRVRFRIGYPNLGSEYNVEWETPAEDDIETLARANKVWDTIVALAPGGLNAFPQTTNDHCGFCAVRNNCRAFKAMTEDLSMSMAGLLQLTPIERYFRLKEAEKLVKSAVEDAKKELLPMLGAKGMPWAGKQAVAKIEEKRTVSALEIWKALIGSDDTYDPAVAADFIARLDELMTVSVTALDEWAKEEPAIKKRIEKLVRKVPNSEATIRLVNPK